MFSVDEVFVRLTGLRKYACIANLSRRRGEVKGLEKKRRITTAVLVRKRVSQRISCARLTNMNVTAPCTDELGKKVYLTSGSCKGVIMDLVHAH